MDFNQKHAICSSTNFRSVYLSLCIPVPDKHTLRILPHIPTRDLRPRLRRLHNSELPQYFRPISSRVFAPSARQLT